MDRRREIERWFAARGVPQLIEGYSTEQRMDARAVPYILAWLVIGTLLIWGRRPQAGPGGQILVSLAALAVILVVLGLVLLLRRHPPLRANARQDLLDIAIIGSCPALWPPSSAGSQSPLSTCSASPASCCCSGG